MTKRIFNTSLFFKNSPGISLGKFIFFLFPILRKNDLDCQVYCAALPGISNARYLIFGKNIYDIFINLRRLGFKRGLQSNIKLLLYIVILTFFHRPRLVALPENVFEFDLLNFQDPKILFVGSSGVNNSFVVKHIIDETLCYSKISNLIRGEETEYEDIWIEKVGSFDFEWKIPKVKCAYPQNGYYVMTTESVSENTSKFDGNLVDLLPMLLDLQSIDSRNVHWEKIHQVEYLKKAIGSSGLSSISKSGINLIDKYIGMEIRCGMGHGDFTPWNVLSDENGKLCLIDFEWSHYKSMPGSDMFHFSLQNHNCFRGTKPLSGQNLSTYQLFFEKCGLPSALIMDFLALHLHYWIAFQVVDAGKSIDHPSLLYFKNLLNEV